MTASCALGVSSPSCRPCPFSSRQAAPICVPDAGQWPSRRVPQAPHAPGHSSSPAPVPTSGGPHTTRGVLQLGRPPARGRGGLPPPGPPSPLVRSRDDPCPSAHWMGRREASCPPGLPAGRQVSLQPPSPLPPTPRVHLHPGPRLREGGAGPAWLWVGAGRPLL